MRARTHHSGSRRPCCALARISGASPSIWRALTHIHTQAHVRTKHPHSHKSTHLACCTAHIEAWWQHVAREKIYIGTKSHARVRYTHTHTTPTRAQLAQLCESALAAGIIKLHVANNLNVMSVHLHRVRIFPFSRRTRACLTFRSLLIPPPLLKKSHSHTHTQNYIHSGCFFISWFEQCCAIDD